MQGDNVCSGLIKQTNYSSLYFFYDFPENFQINNKCNLTYFLDSSITSIFYDRSNIELHKRFQKIDNDNARYGYEILEGPKSIMTKEYIECKEQEMLAFMCRGDN